MFENYTYEALLKSALSRVSADIDKRQGSIIYDAIAPACAELAEAYVSMEMILNNSFADTAIRDYLVLRAKERGLSPNEATYAEVKGKFNCVIPSFSRFSIDGIYYTEVEELDPDSDEDDSYRYYRMLCETAGTEGNKHIGTLLPEETIEGLETAELTEVLVYGEDDETTEDFRQRYFDSFNSDAFGGNRADYINWVKEIDGVGQVRAERTPDGGGTVGVIITDPNNEPATDELVEKVKEVLDPASKTGLGEGVAPIGHSVTVKAAHKSNNEVYLDILTDDESLTTTTAEKRCQAILDGYADELNSQFENREDMTIYAMQLAAKCMEAEGIKNITSYSLNGNDTSTILHGGYLIGFTVMVDSIEVETDA